MDHKNQLLRPLISLWKEKSISAWCGLVHFLLQWVAIGRILSKLSSKVCGCINFAIGLFCTLFLEPKSDSISHLFIPWIGTGLLLANGDKWFRSRKLLTPAFHYGVLKSYVQVYNECGQTLIVSVSVCLCVMCVCVCVHVHVCCLCV